MKIDGYMRIYTGADRGGVVGTVRGEATDRAFAEAIEVSEFDVGSDDSTELFDDTAEGRRKAAQFAKFGFKVGKELDRASPFLFKAFCLTFSKRLVERQNHYALAEVMFRKAGGDAPVEYLKMSFQGVVVTSYSLSVGEDGVAKESVSFRFQACDMTYREQTPAGTAAPPPERKGWSYITNTRQ